MVIVLSRTVSTSISDFCKHDESTPRKLHKAINTDAFESPFQMVVDEQRNKLRTLFILIDECSEGLTSRLDFRRRA